jgi:hypothetical protein
LHTYDDVSLNLEEVGGDDPADAADKIVAKVRSVFREERTKQVVDAITPELPKLLL